MPSMARIFIQYMLVEREPARLEEDAKYIIPDACQSLDIPTGTAQETAEKKPGLLHRAIEGLKALWRSQAHQAIFGGTTDWL